jgi:hypothetical protein
MVIHSSHVDTLKDASEGLQVVATKTGVGVNRAMGNEIHELRRHQALESETQVSRKDGTSRGNLPVRALGLLCQLNAERCLGLLDARTALQDKLMALVNNRRDILLRLDGFDDGLVGDD